MRFRIGILEGAVFFGLFFALLSADVLAGAVKPRFYADGYWVANTTFSSTVEIESAYQPSLSRIRTAVEEQVFLSVYPLWRDDEIATPSLDFKLEAVRIQYLGSQRFRVFYRFEGVFVIKDDVSELRLRWFLAPARTFRNVVRNGKNLCAGGSSRRSFWAEWDLSVPGCPVAEGSDYVWVKPALAPIEETRDTYPEYSRLLDDSGDLRFSLFVGGGFGSGDLCDRRAVPEMLRRLKGYSVRAWSDGEIQARVPAPITEMPRVFDLEKRIENGRIHGLLFCGESGADYGKRNRAFRYFLRDALRDSSIVAYGGHAGYSHNLNLAEIEQTEGFKFQFRSGYQILDITACFPYTYYNTQFFQRKASPSNPKGIRDLEVITPIMIGWYYPKIHLLQAAERWMNGEGPSPYQRILTEYGELSAVAGDEDNPVP